MTDRKNPGLIEMFLTFFRVGAITFGGGYAMLPILEREIVSGKNWVTKEDIMDYYAVSRCLPGIIAVNVSALTGYKKRGVSGGIVSALGVISPSIIIITAIAALFTGFRENVYVQHALSGITVCVLALIISSVISLAKKGITDWFQILIFVCTLVLAFAFGVKPVICVIIAAAAGAASTLFIRRKEP